MRLWAHKSLFQNDKWLCQSIEVSKCTKLYVKRRKMSHWDSGNVVTSPILLFASFLYICSYLIPRAPIFVPIPIFFLHSSISPFQLYPYSQFSCYNRNIFILYIYLYHILYSHRYNRTESLDSCDKSSSRELKN